MFSALFMLTCVLCASCDKVLNAALTRDIRENKENSKVDERVDDIMNVLQGICLTDNPGQTVKQLKKDTQAILNGIGIYKDVVKMNKQLRNEIKWILKESKGRKEESRIIDLLKRDVKGQCFRPRKYKDCTEARKYNKKSGDYTIMSKGVKAYCDMTTDGGGWTVIQRRTDGSINFHRGWNEFKRGFGDVKGELWFGNDNIFLLTANGKYEMRVDFTEENGRKTFAVYKTFSVGDEASKYKLNIGGYSGTAGDSLRYNNGMKFTTIDQDNDTWNKNCASDHGNGAFWLKDCHGGLNGVYRQNVWWNGKYYRFVKTVMMIRKV